VPSCATTVASEPKTNKLQYFYFLGKIYDSKKLKIATTGALSIITRLKKMRQVHSVVQSSERTKMKTQYEILSRGFFKIVCRS